MWIGDWKQVIQYEGISTLCFNCGIVGHRQDVCPELLVRNPPPEMERESLPERNRMVDKREKEEQALRAGEVKDYGPWILVAGRKKKSPARAMQTKEKDNKNIHNGYLQTRRSRVDKGGTEMRQEGATALRYRKKEIARGGSQNISGRDMDEYESVKQDRHMDSMHVEDQDDQAQQAIIMEEDALQVEEVDKGRHEKLLDTEMGCGEFEPFSAQGQEPTTQYAVDLEQNIFKSLKQIRSEVRCSRCPNQCVCSFMNEESVIIQGSSVVRPRSHDRSGQKENNEKARPAEGSA